MKSVFKSFVEDTNIPALKSGWKPIEQKIKEPIFIKENVEVVSLNANDFVQLFFGVSDVAAQIASPAVPTYSPNIPPVILTVTQVAL